MKKLSLILLCIVALFVAGAIFVTFGTGFVTVGMSGGKLDLAIVKLVLTLFGAIVLPLLVPAVLSYFFYTKGRYKMAALFSVLALLLVLASWLWGHYNKRSVPAAAPVAAQGLATPLH